MRPWRDDRGFTLIELLIVVAIIGMIVAIAIPSLLSAIDRGKQKRTMADIRSSGTATEAYAVDLNFYPRNITTATKVSGGGANNLGTYLTPTFIKIISAVDGWGGDILYNSDPLGSQYTIQSYGKDGKAMASTTRGKTTGFDCDIMYSAGGFVAWPEGIQT